MFEFLLKYPPAVYSKGKLALIGIWPAWALLILLLLAAGLLAWITIYRAGKRAGSLSLRRRLALWALQAGTASLLLLMLWRPAVQVAALQPQQNLVAVIVDDSASMALRDAGGSRLEAARAVLDGGLLEGLRERFMVRLYRAGKELARIEKPEELSGAQPASRIAAALRQVADDSAGLPVGAVVLLSDGADNEGGIDLETVRRIRRYRIPVHTIGFGREKMSRDVELVDVSIAPRALPDSRLTAGVTLRQAGFDGESARLVLKDGDRVLASSTVKLAGVEAPQTETLTFNAGSAGARNLEVSVELLAGEENRKNNTLTRLLNVEALKPRILLIEGEPRWEFKFIRRAAGEDQSLELASILRTTQNKIYRQGIATPTELEDGFPSTAEDLFAFRGIILGSVEANYFSPAQLELLREFVDRRGGGLLVLGGRDALAEGAYATSALAEALPVTLPARKGTFRREEAGFRLTRAGGESLICRLEDSPEKNADRWKRLPLLADYQDPGTPKPGALVLLESAPKGKGPLPLLITQNYGRGRSGVLATGGTWRWQMLQDHTDHSHEWFWQQLLRWLVAEAPGQVVASTPQPVLADRIEVPVRVEVRDKSFNPVSDGQVEARILGPAGVTATLELRPSEDEPGIYSTEWNASAAGSYLAEIVARRGEAEVGRDVLMFRREDGVAENFRTEQNRELLEKLAGETGGAYYTPANASRLLDEISYSEAGSTVLETKDLWNLPVLFLLLFSLRAAEWLLRRNWGRI